MTDIVVLNWFRSVAGQFARDGRDTDAANVRAQARAIAHDAFAIPPRPSSDDVLAWAQSNVYSFRAADNVVWLDGRRLAAGGAP